MSFNLMLAKDYQPDKVKNWDSTYVEPKLNGVRVVVVVKKASDGPVYYSRNGRELTMFSHLNDGVMLAYRTMRAAHYQDFSKGVVFDAEMTGADFSDISGAIHRKDATVKTAELNVFTVLPLEALEDGHDYASQDCRYRILDRELNCKVLQEERFYVLPRFRACTSETVDKFYKKFRRNEKEGAMVKDHSQAWVAKRSWAWMKMKDELTVDVPIVGFKEGTGKYVGTLGALIVEYKGVEVPVSGMTDRQRHEIWRNKKKYKGKIVEVSYQEETVHGSLRHPRFVRERPDKE